MLQRLARPPEDDALEALARGDMEALGGHLDAMERGPAGLDALSGHTLARKIGKLRSDFGEARTLEALRRIGTQLMHSWVLQWQAGDARGAIADLVALFRHQVGGALAPLEEDDQAVTLQLSPCGSGGRLERQKLPERHPAAYGGWSDGISSYCQGCKANQQALNDALGAPAWTSQKGPDGQCRLRFDKLGQRGQPLFTEQERVTLTRTRLQQARDQLEIGDSGIAPLLQGQRKDWRPWHDFGVVWLAHFYAVALEFGGPDYLDEVLAQTYEPAFVAGFPRYAALDDEGLVREIALTWNYHCADFRLHEEDERFVFTLDPCGSGGRLFRGQMWRDLYRYGRPLSPTVPGPHPIVFMRRDAPSYCSHCAASNRAQLSRAADPSVPLFFVIDGTAQARPGLPCRTYVYKKGADRARIEPRLFRMVGLDVPG
jgi:hypothetical protein